MTPEERYQRDALFRMFVDQLEYYIRQAVFSGTEIREAAMLALIHHERTTFRPFRIYPAAGVEGGRLEYLEPPPPVRPTALTSQTIDELRAAVREGAGHACAEWLTTNGTCALCGRVAGGQVRIHPSGRVEPL
jgi:hypothetical protein